MALAMAKAAKQEEAISHKEEEAMSHTAKEDDSDGEIVDHMEEEAMSHKAQEDGIELREGPTSPKALPVTCASCLQKDETISELVKAMAMSYKAQCEAKNLSKLGDSCTPCMLKDAEIRRLGSILQCRTG